MSERYTLIAFCAILFAICYLATIASILAHQQRYAEALGFGGITTGLVGVLGTFKPRTSVPDTPQDVNVTNTKEKPVQTEEAGNLASKPEEK